MPLAVLARSGAAAVRAAPAANDESGVVVSSLRTVAEVTAACRHGRRRTGFVHYPRGHVAARRGRVGRGLSAGRRTFGYTSAREGASMRIARQITVFDAADIATESAFWASLLGGEVYPDEDFHSIIVDGKWRFGVQRAPHHVAPDWPDGAQQQQVHLDLHVDDIRAAHAHATSLGARLLKAADDLDADEGHQVYADPAGHPFCLGWHRDVPPKHDFGATAG